MHKSAASHPVGSGGSDFPSSPLFGHLATLGSGSPFPSAPSLLSPASPPAVAAHQPSAQGLYVISSLRKGQSLMNSQFEPLPAPGPIQIYSQSPAASQQLVVSAPAPAPAPALASASPGDGDNDGGAASGSDRKDPKSVPRSAGYFQFPPIIHLNVGGVKYSTSLETLTSVEPSSMLASMFSGSFPIRQDEEGFFFIDRDGTHFRHILNYLRYGRLHVSLARENADAIAQIKEEADFYQLPGLISLLAENKTYKNSLCTPDVGSELLALAISKVAHQGYFAARDSILAKFRLEAEKGNLVWQLRFYHHDFETHVWQPVREQHLRTILQYELSKMNLSLKYAERFVLGTSEKIYDFEGSIVHS